MIQKIRPQDVLRKDASVFGLLGELVDDNLGKISEINHIAGCIANSSAASRYSPELLEQKIDSLYQHYMSERGVTYYPTGKKDFVIHLTFNYAMTDLRDANNLEGEPYFLIIRAYQVYDLIQRMFNIIKKPLDDRLKDKCEIGCLAD